MAMLGRVPSGHRQVAGAELCQDLDCSWHVGVRHAVIRVSLDGKNEAVCTFDGRGIAPLLDGRTH